MPLFIYKGYIHRLIIMKKHNIRVRLLFIYIFVVFALLLFATVAYAENPIISLREETPVDEINYTIEEEEKFTQRIKECVNNLLSLSISDDIFTNVIIQIQPSHEINHTNGKAKGLTTTSNGGDLLTITLAMSADEDTLYHELGHVVENKKLGTFGYDWTKANEIGQKYVDEKKYCKELNGEAQRKLPWQDRIAEWFAEDVRQFILETITKNKKVESPPNDSSFAIYRGVGPRKTKEIDSLIHELLTKSAAQEIGASPGIRVKHGIISLGMLDTGSPAGQDCQGKDFFY